MNDKERAQWINNDEGLYNWKRSVRLPMRKFIELNRADIDAVIERVTNGSKPTPATITDTTLLAHHKTFCDCGATHLDCAKIDCAKIKL